MPKYDIFLGKIIISTKVEQDDSMTHCLTNLSI